MSIAPISFLTSGPWFRDDRRVETFKPAQMLKLIVPDRDPSLKAVSGTVRPAEMLGFLAS